MDTFKRSVKKIREGRGSIQQALDTFLLTYRTTPNLSAPEGRSPSEIMFGRRIRTSLDLLRPPAVREATEQPGSRSFSKGDSVYAKVHSNNSWRWAPGVILERIGQVMFNAWVEDRRMIRSHINQLRSRTNADSKSTSGSIPSKADKQQLPLDILLRAWNLHKPSQPQPPGPSTSPRPSPPAAPVAQTPSTPATPAEHSTPQQILPSTPASPSLVWVTPESTTDHRESSSITSTSTSVVPSSSATSPVPPTTTETETAVQVPRRSSRLRRPPIRFDPYQLY